MSAGANPRSPVDTLNTSAGRREGDVLAVACRWRRVASSSVAHRSIDDCVLHISRAAEMTMGQLVTGHRPSGSTNLSGSRGSRVSTRDPLTDDQVNEIPRTGYFVAVMMFDFESTPT